MSRHSLCLLGLVCACAGSPSGDPAPLSSSRAAVTITDSAGTLTIVSPSGGDTVASPVTLNASCSANPGFSVASMQVYWDGSSSHWTQSFSGTATASISQPFSEADGGHTFIVKCWLNGSSSALASSSIGITVSSSAGGSFTDADGALTVTSPANGASVTSPVTVSASCSANSGRSVASMQVYWDNTRTPWTQRFAGVPSASISQPFSEASGAHALIVKCWFNGASGALASTSFNVTVSGSTPPDAGPGVDAGSPPPDAGPGGGIQKVIVILMENQDNSGVYGNSAAPYINSLIGTYAYATNYQNVVHPSEPNYVWLEAGTNAFSDVTFTTDNDPSASNSTGSTLHLATLLGHSGRSWRSYDENENSSTGLCPVVSSGSYAAKHNPFVFFRDVSGSPPSQSNAFCQSHVVPFGQLASDLAANALPDYAFITPNLCDDMHDCGAASGDSWLKNTPEIQQLIARAADPANHTMLVIEWDESESTNLHPMVLIAAPSFLSGGHANSTALTHSSYVKSLQEIFQVDPSHVDPTNGRPYPWLGNAGGSGVNDFGSFFAAGQL